MCILCIRFSPSQPAKTKKRFGKWQQVALTSMIPDSFAAILFDTDGLTFVVDNAANTSVYKMIF